MSQAAARTMNSALDRDHLLSCVRTMFNDPGVTIAEWNCEPIDYKTPNFTNGGVFRIQGRAVQSDQAVPWSIVLKIACPDKDRDAASHYNYWKREALIYQSGLLHNLPDLVKAPQCYSVQEKPDGTVWLWLEDIPGDNDDEWSIDDFCFVAQQLGRLNGAYLLGQPLPGDSPVCRGWMRSWVAECRKYADPIEPASGENSFFPDLRLPMILDRFNVLNSEVDNILTRLEQLPRVLAHQDVWQKNLFIDRTVPGGRRLTMIDWQFTSISGIGEDLGRFSGLCMSKNNIPFKLFGAFRDIIFDRYAEGLTEFGWEGDVRLAQFGYHASFALRSMNEVPKLFKLISSIHRSDESKRGSTVERVGKLASIVSLQLDAADAAIELMHCIDTESF